MFKRDIIRQLHEMDVRRVEKPGYGKVALQHLKFSDLCVLLQSKKSQE